MNSYKKLIIALLSFILAACATARYDDPAVILKIDDSTYQIRYVGMNDSSIKLKKYVTVKAAEITLRENIHTLNYLMRKVEVQ